MVALSLALCVGGALRWKDKKHNKETSSRWRLPPLGAARVSVRAADERLLFPLAVPARTGPYPRMRST